MDLITINLRSEKAQETSSKRLAYLTESYLNSDLRKDMISLVDEEKAHNYVPDNGRSTYPLLTSAKAALPAYRALPILIYRAYLNMIRAPLNSMTRLMQILAFSVI